MRIEPAADPLRLAIGFEVKGTGPQPIFKTMMDLY